MHPWSIILDLVGNPWCYRDLAQSNPIHVMPIQRLSDLIRTRSLGFNCPLWVSPSMELNFKSISRRLRAAAIAFLAPIAIMSSLMLSPQPAMAMVSHTLLTTTTFGTMSNRIDAAAKDAEGKLESAYGDLSGDTGHQIKGKGKQVQASAMNAAEDVKEGARSAGKKIADATDKK